MIKKKKVVWIFFLNVGGSFPFYIRSLCDYQAWLTFDRGHYSSLIEVVSFTIGLSSTDDLQRLSRFRSSFCIGHRGMSRLKLPKVSFFLFWSLLFLKRCMRLCRDSDIRV